MGNFIFILGGARSGKSAYAQARAKEESKEVTYIATAEIGDAEMRKRIAKHISSRPKHWKTIEEPLNLIGAIERCKGKTKVILIDCLTLYLSNMMLKGMKAFSIQKTIKDLARYMAGLAHTVFLISNEVGLGIVPENKMAREFRDIAGLANQIMAKSADEVIFMQAGIPLTLKKGELDGEVKADSK